MKFSFLTKAAADFDVAGFGTNAVDYLIRVPVYPEYNSKVEISAYSREAGGEVASTLVGLERLGFRTAYAGRFGSDESGSFGLESLKNEGVDISYAERAECPTQVGFILIDESTGERTVLWHRDERLAYTATDAPLTLAGRARILHMTAHDTGACVAMAKAAREAGVIVSLDVDRVFDGVNDLLPLVDILTTTSEFVENMAGSPDSQRSLADIAAKFGCGVVGVTLGRDGSLIYSAGVFIETRGFDVPGGCKDTTGAGDAFRAGLLYGVLTGESIETSARIANAVAALKCRGTGARSALPDKQELTTFIK
jgi:sugar/nucleoside kinase (ribokinase family)